MHDKAQLRLLVQQNLTPVVGVVNQALAGQGLDNLEPVLTRIGRGHVIPHWYKELKTNRTLPNLDGKTIGSVIEMLLVAVLETTVLAKSGIKLRMNPARGVDLPDLDLGVKSPSTNYCTSEPFFSAYERLYGNEHDAVVLLTDYQDAKRKPPLRLSILNARYLKGTEIADENLCRTARKHRDWLVATNEVWAQKIFKFLAHVNQSDWRAKVIVRLIDSLRDEEGIKRIVTAARSDFARQNSRREIPFADSEMAAIESVIATRPLELGVIDAADNWVTEILQEAGRMPNGNEWQRLKNGPLDGKIGMSFALQWRYNFGRVFGATAEEASAEDCS